MKRLTAFLLALAAVFVLAFSLWSPGHGPEKGTEETAQEDEWVGYFFSLEPFSERKWATETEEGDFDFGVPGMMSFFYFRQIQPDEADYEEGSDYNMAVGVALSEGISSGGTHISSGGTHISTGDTEDCYEFDSTITFSQGSEATLMLCDVYRTAEGAYYAVCTGEGYAACDGVSVQKEHSTRCIVNGKERSKTVKIGVSFRAGCAVERAGFTWLDEAKNVVLREEFSADALPVERKAPEGAVLLILTEQQKGENGAVTARRAFTQEDTWAEFLVPSQHEGLLHEKEISLRWEA